MKKTIRTGVMLAVFLATTLNYANANNFTTNVDNTIITFNKVNEGDELLIKDSRGLTLYRENIEVTGQYQKTFDLTSLPDGDYYFELTKDLEIRAIPFKVTNTVVVFNKEKEVVTYKPTVRIKENRLLISRLSMNKEPLDVKIYYDNVWSGSEELIRSDQFDDKTIVEKVYKLDKYKKGNYKVVFTTANSQFVERVKL